MRPIVLVFVAGAIISWGIYVPTVHEGSRLLEKSSLRAFFCVGIAYFLVAVLVPLGLMLSGVESWNFNLRGASLAGLAGFAGAAGALCVIFAATSGGTPWLIAPLVFAGAPIVNAVVSGWWHPTGGKPHFLYYAGMVLAATGMFLVLLFKPAAPKASVPSEPPAHAAAEAPVEGRAP